jgi:hypothetical protein
MPCETRYKSFQSKAAMKISDRFSEWIERHNNDAFLIYTIIMGSIALIVLWDVIDHVLLSAPLDRL